MNYTFQESIEFTHKPISILFLPKEQYPNDRIRLRELFEKEFAWRGNNIFWVMQSKDPLNISYKFKHDNNHFYITPSVSPTPIGRIFNKILLIRKYHIASKLLKEKNIDLVLVSDGNIESLIGIVLSKKHSKPLCFYLTSLFYSFSIEKGKLKKGFPQFIDFFIGSINKRLIKYVIGFSQIFHPISSYMGDLLIEKGLASNATTNFIPLHLCIGHDFLNKTSRNIKSKEYISNRKETIIIYTGKLAQIRKLDFMIRVLKIITKANDRYKIKLYIVGIPENKYISDQLKEYAIKLGVDNNVQFFEDVPYSDIPNFLCNSTIGISPLPPIEAYVVSSPTKCIEYLAAEIPIVANSEILDQNHIISSSGGGFSVPYDENEFADAIIWLMENPAVAKKMGRDGRDWIENNRHYKNLASFLEKQYYELISSDEDICY